MDLTGKRIILGVTGSIAAFKSALLTRLLVKAGAEVQIIMSASASEFITPLTLSSLSKRPVLLDFFDKKSGLWHNHVDLGLWADLFIVAPLSANTLSKFANGLCDNLLTAVYLSSRCPVMLAPAMDLDMYQHPSVKANLEKVASFGNMVLDAKSGELASGLYGQGRLMEPEQILDMALDFFHSKSDFQWKKVLVTMGPTQEAIDPIRFISNHSSGKMGLALANSFRIRGAEVILVSGPVNLDLRNFKVVQVYSAKEMFEAASSLHDQMDICVFAAAVADYAPANVPMEKIKKQEDELTMVLKKNVDIAYELGKVKKQGQLHIGFALETENGEEYAREKLFKKNFDLIVLNSTKEEGAGFQHDTNKVLIFHQNGKRLESELLPKSKIADLILDEIKHIPVWV